MRLFLSIFIAIVLILQVFGCNNQTPQKRNAELVVTYNGQEVHRAGTKYKSLEQFHKLLEEPKKKYIIFSAEWCKSCKFLQKALEQGGFEDKVTLLNIEEPWVARLAMNLKIKNVPTMIVADKKGQIIAGRVGSPPIVLYLVVNVK